MLESLKRKSKFPNFILSYLRILSSFLYKRELLPFKFTWNFSILLFPFSFRLPVFIQGFVFGFVLSLLFLKSCALLIFYFLCWFNGVHTHFTKEILAIEFQFSANRVFIPRFVSGECFRMSLGNLLMTLKLLQYRSQIFSFRFHNVLTPTLAYPSISFFIFQSRKDIFQRIRTCKFTLPRIRINNISHVPSSVTYMNKRWDFRIYGKKYEKK